MNKLISLLESLETESNSSLIDVIRKGYYTIFESDEEKKNYEKTISFKFRNSDGSIKRLLDMFKTKKRGILLIDPDGDHKEPIACYLIPERKPEDYKYSDYNTYNVSITDDEDGKPTCEILVKSSDKERLNKVIENFNKLFNNIGSIGNCGHSYDIKYIPNDSHAKIDYVGWDGDGSDYLDVESIKIK